MVPWAYQMLQGLDYRPPKNPASWLHPLQGLLWVRWLVQPYGFESLNHPLVGDYLRDFFRYPLLSGRPTFLVGCLHLLLAALFVAVGVPALRRLWRRRADWPALFVGRSSATAFTLAAGFWGFGILFTLTLRPFRYQYFLVSMPLMFVWAARMALSLEGVERPALAPRRALALVCVAQGLLTLAFLGYVRVNQRELAGDYGTPYRAQRPAWPVGALSAELRDECP
jgi:hypothetical protein